MSFYCCELSRYTPDQDGDKWYRCSEPTDAENAALEFSELYFGPDYHDAANILVYDVTENDVQVMRPTLTMLTVHPSAYPKGFDIKSVSCPE